MTKQISATVQPLLEEFKATRTPEVVAHIEARIGRELDRDKDHVFIDWQSGSHRASGETFEYGAILFKGVVYGLLTVNWAEPDIDVTLV